MLSDNYTIKSTIAPKRKGVNQNIRTFLEFFNAFYNKLRIREFPNFFHDMCDPYGFALMCEDYKSKPLNMTWI